MSLRCLNRCAELVVVMIAVPLMMAEWMLNARQSLKLKAQGETD
jgi:hypothetical protein